MRELEWRKSSRSGKTGACVEVAMTPSARAVRDSKAPDGGQLRVSARQWVAFLSRVKAGRCDT